MYRRVGLGFFALLIAGTLSQLHAQTTQTVTITSVVPQVLSLGDQYERGNDVVSDHRL